MLLCLVLLMALSQEEAALAREKVEEARSKCAVLIGGMDGVVGIHYAGSGADYRLMIVVRDAAAKAAAREKLGGDKVGDIRVLWTVTASATVVEVSNKPAPPPPPVNTIPAPPENEGPECDIVRAQLGLKPLHRPVGGASFKSWIPCQVWLRAVEGPAGGHSYLYTKHRPGCPYQDGLASEVYREGFLYPWGLRGSDNLWHRQVGQDLANKFPPPPPPMVPKSYPYRRDVPTGP
jgi:hypothetical protein